jgi:hypothetical protein
VIDLVACVCSRIGLDERETLTAMPGNGYQKTKRNITYQHHPHRQKHPDRFRSVVDTVQRLGVVPFSSHHPWSHLGHRLIQPLIYPPNLLGY